MDSLYVFVLILAFNGMANGLQCYTCYSTSKQPCIPETCRKNTPHPHQCAKITIELLNGTELILKECMQLPQGVNCSASPIKRKAQEFFTSLLGEESVRNFDCVSCPTDLCNSAEKYS